jgi:hypothetical protein
MIFISDVPNANGNLMDSPTGMQLRHKLGYLCHWCAMPALRQDLGRYPVRETCRRMRQREPHLDWYDGLNDIVDKLKEEIKESWHLAPA